MVRDAFLDSLNCGIQAAQAGNRLLARIHIEEALGINPRSAVAWVWLAWTADNPQQSAHYLKKAHEINPQHPVVKAGLYWSQALEVFRLPGAPEKPAAEPTAVEQTATAEVEVAEPNTPDAMPTTVVQKQMIETVVTHRTSHSVEQPIAKDPRIPEPVPCGTGPLVLVVDDSPTLSRVVSAMLNRCGYRAQTVHSGPQALAAVENCLPDAVLLDVMMPDMDGYEVCKLLKGNSHTRHIPVIMLSGRDDFMDRALGRMAGCDEYLTKPFQQERLLQTLRDVISAAAN